MNITRRSLVAGTHGDDLRVFSTEDAVTIERPNRLKPAGDAATVAQFIGVRGDKVAWIETCDCYEPF